MITENYSKIEKQRQKLVATYQSLVELDRSIVQLFSVIYTPVSRNLFFECFQKTGLWGLTPLTAAALKPYLDRLLTNDLLIPTAKNTLQINPLIAEIATRAVVTAGRFTLIAQVVAEKLPIAKHRYSGQRQFENRGEFIREVRLGLYSNDLSFINEQFGDYYNSYYSRSSDLISQEQLWLLICNNPFDPEWVQTLIPELTEIIWLHVLGYSLKHLIPADAAFDSLAAAYRDAPTLITEDLQIELVEQLLLRGKVAAAKELLDS